MDRKWVNAGRMSKEYRDGVKEFVSFAVQHSKDTRFILCPCWRCLNIREVNGEDLLEEHLMRFGFNKTYTCWTKHGEPKGSECSSSRLGFDSWAMNTKDTCDVDETEDNPSIVKDIPFVVDDELRDHPDMHERLRADVEKPLWRGCTKFSKLSGLLALYDVKAAHQLTDATFTHILRTVAELLPDDNLLPRKTYTAKQVLKSMGLTHERIHACRKDCILFRGQYANLKECPKCGSQRYRKDNSAAKVMWYFPIIPRFRRLFNNEEDAKNLTWHKGGRIKDGMMRHPADSPQWETFDMMHPEFGNEPRNLRLVLSTDGMNPYGIQSVSHSTWPVLLIIYNLPPWLCMKRKYIMMSVLISGPRQPGNDIDVYLAPLIEDLKTLWEEGVQVYDKYRKEQFTLRAMLFGTINDFPAYGNLSGYSVKGQCACPCCYEDTDHIRLKNCRKSVYMGHRHWLKKSHRWRKMTSPFNGQTEERLAPPDMTGEEVFEKVKDLHTELGKDFAKHVPTRGWKKRSIFYQLEYWKELRVKHFIDVMHVVKNVFESVFGTLLGVDGRTKDGLNARMDMTEMRIRAELAPVIEEGRKPFLPPAAHTLSKAEKKTLLETLHSIKVPEGYSSNIKSLVSFEESKLKGCKSHDCHAIMLNFLPIAIRSILPDKVRMTITKLCFFFKAICGKVIDPNSLSNLQNQIVETLCELEMYFPPSFFDIMVHLPVHLVNETRICGHARMRWMYPVERHMKVLKGYVKSMSRPEGCIAERYLIEEAINYWSEYIPNAEVIGLPVTRHSGRRDGAGVGSERLVEITRQQWVQAHLYVLHNSIEVEPYVTLHKEMLMQKNVDKGIAWIEKEHNQTFIEWFKLHVSKKLMVDNEPVLDRVKWLSRRPRIHVFSYKCYLINGYTFYTRENDERSTMQNSGVSVLARALHQSSAKDRNPIFADMTYFGVIENMWDLDYMKFRVPVFDVRWVENTHGVQVDALGFMRVDLNRVGYKDDSFILASQAQQVFYVGDPVDKKWSIVILSNKLNNIYQGSENVDEDVDALDDPFLGINIPTSFNEDEDERSYQRHDHDEGEYVNPEFYAVQGHQKSKPNKKRKRKAGTLKHILQIMTSRSCDRGGSRAPGSREDSRGCSGEDNGGGSGASGSGAGGSSSLNTTGSINIKKKRGLVTMMRVAKNRKSGKLIEVEWNANGQPIGSGSISLTRSLGSLAREKVPITCDNWRDTKYDGERQTIWEELLLSYMGIEDSEKKQTLLKRTGELHRGFRTRLRNMTRDEDGNLSSEPPLQYKTMSSVALHWAEFIKNAQTDEFKEKRKKNLDSAKNMEARYNKACIGYARLREQILEDKIKNGLPPTVTRMDTWWAGRQGKKVDPIAEQIHQDALAIVADLDDEELNTIGPNDLLARAIKLPEHPGRLRGVGFGVTKKKLFGSTSSTSQVTQLQKVVNKLVCEVERLKAKGVEHAVEDDNDPDAPSSHGGSYDPEHPLPEGEGECSLYLLSPRRVVGRGWFYNRPNDMLHSVPVAPGHVRVRVVATMPAEHKTPLPVPDSEVETIGAAVGYFIAWPRNLVSNEAPESTTPVNLDKGKMKTYESTVADTIRPIGYPLEGDIDHVGASEIVNILLDSEQSLDVSIEMGPRYCNNATWDEHVSKEQLSKVLDDGWLSASSVSLYIRYLCDIHLSQNPDMEKRFSFISPHLISHSTNHAEGCKIVWDIMERHGGAHWVLVAINTRTENLYFLDPISGMTIAKRRGLQKVVESAMMSYQVNRSQGVRNIAALNMYKWVNIECPKSEDSHSSAIFVLLFIEEILLRGDTAIPIPFVKLKTYSLAKLEMFKKDWAGYLYNRFIRSSVLAKAREKAKAKGKAK